MYTTREIIIINIAHKFIVIISSAIQLIPGDSKKLTALTKRIQHTIIIPHSVDSTTQHNT